MSIRFFEIKAVKVRGRGGSVILLFHLPFLGMEQMQAYLIDNTGSVVPLK